MYENSSLLSKHFWFEIWVIWLHNFFVHLFIPQNSIFLNCSLWSSNIAILHSEFLQNHYWLSLPKWILCQMFLQFNYKSLPGICSIEQWFDCKCYNVRKALLHSTFKIYWNSISPSSIQVCHSYQIFQNNHMQSIRELNISSEFTI